MTEQEGMIKIASERRTLYKLTKEVLQGALPAASFVDKVKNGSIGGDTSISPSLTFAMADTLWMCWVELDASATATVTTSTTTTTTVDLSEGQSNLIKLAKHLIKDGFISQQCLKEVADGDFLEWCGLIVSRDAWKKKEVRVNTVQVYTQRKYNLLREESEGYAKLTTLLNQSGAGVLKCEDVHLVVSEITSLVGYFDLDPNRVFSVVLDSFSQQPNNTAFLELMPLFKKEATNQILGFHFARYQSLGQSTPTGLYVAAARLLKAGLANLDVVLAHTAPKHDVLKAMISEATEKAKERVKNIGVVSLTAGTNTTTGGKDGGVEAKASHPPPPPLPPQRRSGLSAEGLDLDGLPYLSSLTKGVGQNNQLFGLLASCLEVEHQPAVDELLHRLTLGGVVDPCLFTNIGKAVCLLISKELDEPYAVLYPNGARRAAAEKPREGVLSLSNKEVLHTLLSEQSKLGQRLKLVGRHLYHDVKTLTRLIRVLAGIAAHRDGETSTSDDLHKVKDILSHNVLPAVSLIPGNAALTMEVWKVLSHFPYTERFCLYADLNEDAGESLLLTAGAKLAGLEVRRILRRVTSSNNKKEARATMKPLGRMLAKIAHAAPLPVAEQLIRQVMGLPGMVTSVIEALGFLTPMTFDIMTFAILKTFASSRRKLKEDGVNLEEWFQYLSLFTGLMAKKHNDVEVNALLQYVANQLKESQSLDLLVLKEMITTMTGVQAIFDISEPQMDALAGSLTLQAEVVTPGEKGPEDRSLLRGSNRLLNALKVGSQEQQLLLPLFILLAQQRTLIVLQPPSNHLKLVSELLDKCHETTMQYISYLQHALSPAEYKALLPSIQDLAAEYRIDAEIIFQIHRPIMKDVKPTGKMIEEEGDDGEKEKKKKKVKVEEEAKAKSTAGDGEKKGKSPEEMEDGQVNAATTTPTQSQQQKLSVKVKMEDVLATEPEEIEKWQHLQEQLRSLAPGGTGFQVLSPTLYAIFWTLSLYDIDVPVGMYESTMARLRTTARLAKEDIQSASRGADRMGGGGGGGGGYHSHYHHHQYHQQQQQPTVDVEQLRKDVERCDLLLDKLPAELKAQQLNAAQMAMRLQCTKTEWVTEGSAAARQALAKEFVQYCSLPRVLNSPTDALFCARFLKQIHQLGVPHFPLLTVIDRQMREFGFLVRCTTPREATNLGIFLNEMLSLVEHWRDADVFSKECATSPAFMTFARGVVVQITHAEFLKLTTNWQKFLAVDVFISCVESGDYMQIKNALLVLNRMVKIFPAVGVYAERLRKAVEPIRDNETREDLKTLAGMYCTTLSASAKGKGRTMAASAEEYAGLKPKRKPKNGEEKDSSKGTSTKLRPDAEPFVPDESKASGKEERPAVPSSAVAIASGGDGSRRGLRPPPPPPPIAERKRKREDSGKGNAAAGTVDKIDNNKNNSSGGNKVTTKREGGEGKSSGGRTSSRERERRKEGEEKRPDNDKKDRDRKKDSDRGKDKKDDSDKKERDSKRDDDSKRRESSQRRDVHQKPRQQQEEDKKRSRRSEEESQKDRKRKERGGGGSSRHYQHPHRREASEKDRTEGRKRGRDDDGGGGNDEATKRARVDEAPGSGDNNNSRRRDDNNNNNRGQRSSHRDGGRDRADNYSNRRR